MLFCVRVVDILLLFAERTNSINLVIIWFSIEPTVLLSAQKTKGTLKYKVHSYQNPYKHGIFTEKFWQLAERFWNRELTFYCVLCVWNKNSIKSISISILVKYVHYDWLRHKAKQDCRRWAINEKIMKNAPYTVIIEVLNPVLLFMVISVTASGGLIQKWSWVIFRRAPYKMLMYSLCAFRSWRQWYYIACVKDSYSYIIVFPCNPQRPQRAFKSSQTLIYNTA